MNNSSKKFIITNNNELSVLSITLLLITLFIFTLALSSIIDIFLFKNFDIINKNFIFKLTEDTDNNIDVNKSKQENTKIQIKNLSENNPSSSDSTNENSDKNVLYQKNNGHQKGGRTNLAIQLNDSKQIIVKDNNIVNSNNYPNQNFRIAQNIKNPLHLDFELDSNNSDYTVIDISRIKDIETLNKQIKLNYNQLSNTIWKIDTDLTDKEYLIESSKPNSFELKQNEFKLLQNKLWDIQIFNQQKEIFKLTKQFINNEQLENEVEHYLTNCLNSHISKWQIVISQNCEINNLKNEFRSVNNFTEEIDISDNNWDKFKSELNNSIKNIYNELSNDLSSVDNDISNFDNDIDRAIDFNNNFNNDISNLIETTNQLSLLNDQSFFELDDDDINALHNSNNNSNLSDISLQMNQDLNSTSINDDDWNDGIEDIQLSNNAYLLRDNDDNLFLVYDNDSTDFDSLNDSNIDDLFYTNDFNSINSNNSNNPLVNNNNNLNDLVSKASKVDMWNIKF
jgi:hypothetical protein